MFRIIEIRVKGLMFTYLKLETCPQEMDAPTNTLDAELTFDPEV